VEIASLIGLTQLQDHGDLLQIAFGRLGAIALVARGREVVFAEHVGGDQAIAHRVGDNTGAAGIFPVLACGEGAGRRRRIRACT
jgi:hypothetical protein